MTNGEAINWIINISADIGKAEHRDLWHYEQALSEIKEMFETSQPEPQWIPVTKKAHPDTPFRVQIQMDNGWIITAYYQEGEWLSVPDCGEPLRDEWVEAWRELPEPYREEG